MSFPLVSKRENPILIDPFPMSTDCIFNIYPIISHLCGSVYVGYQGSGIYIYTYICNEMMYF